MMREGLTITHYLGMEGPKTIEALAGPDHFGNGIEVGFAQTSDALEMGQQCRAGFLSDSLYSVKFRDSLRLAAAVAVVGYSKRWASSRRCCTTRRVSLFLSI